MKISGMTEWLMNVLEDYANCALRFLLMLDALTMSAGQLLIILKNALQLVIQPWKAIPGNVQMVQGLMLK